MSSGGTAGDASLRLCPVIGRGEVDGAEQFGELVGRMAVRSGAKLCSLAVLDCAD
jgi:hypothetical protein